MENEQGDSETPELIPHPGIGSRDSCLSASKSTMMTFTSGVSRVLRYAAMSTPRRKTVESDTDGWTANKASDDASDASIMVRTAGNDSLVTDKGDTGGDRENYGSISEYLHSDHEDCSVGACVLASLFTPNRLLRRSSGANRRSLRLNFFPRAAELVSVSSWAKTTTGVWGAVFDVFGLKTSVFTSR